MDHREADQGPEEVDPVEVAEEATGVGEVDLEVEEGGPRGDLMTDELHDPGRHDALQCVIKEFSQRCHYFMQAATWSNCPALGSTVSFRGFSSNVTDGTHSRSELYSYFWTVRGKESKIACHYSTWTAKLSKERRTSYKTLRMI